MHLNWSLENLKKKKKCIMYIIQTDLVEFVSAKFNICSYRLNVKNYIVYLSFEIKHLYSI